jgi:predicted phage terminase large subunit-like protein
VMLSMPPRAGKLLADDTPVLTVAGWKNHGDLVVGDMVISPTGSFVPVTHVFPKDIANRLVTFTNGEQIQCHSEHEWVVYDRSCARTRTVDTAWLETQRMASGVPNTRGHRYRFQLNHRTPLDTDEQTLHVDPYTLGVWLGDGTTNKPLICGSDSDISVLVPNIAYAPVWRYTHTTTGVKYVSFETQLRKDLQKYGMCQSRNATAKHIPDVYLTASKRQRLELLAGLLDTDGSLRKTEHRYTFTTVSDQIRDDVVSLISTFGWRAGCVTYRPATSSSGIIGRLSYHSVSFCPTEHIPCRMTRKQLHAFAKPRRVGLQSIARVSPKSGNCISVEGGVYCVGRQLVPTHNSTLGLLFLGWLTGRNPDDPILATGYAEKITKMFHTGIKEIYEDSEYNYRAIFPLLDLVNISADDLTLDFRSDGKKATRKYKSITCRAIDGSLTGATEARQLLYVDDLVRDIEEAMNLSRLNTLCTKLTTNVYSRKKEGCKELHIGTRWSVHDPMGMVERQHEDDPRCKVITLPALDPVTDESNFDYPYGVGFSTEYYRSLRTKEDDVTWQCVYQQQPVERSGLLFPMDELKFTYGIPDISENPPDDIFAFCDVAFGGDDFLACPIAYQWGDDSPIIADVVFIKGGYKTTEPLVSGTLINRGVRRAVFEANNGGDFYSRDVDKLIRKTGYRINITALRAGSNKSKETRIVQHSPAIKDFTFLHPTSDDMTPMYRTFLAGLTTYTMTGKNPNDDAPDSLAGLAAMLRTNLNATVTIYDRTHI